MKPIFPMMRLVAAGLFVALLQNAAHAASLIGDEVYFHRMSDHTIVSFDRLYEEGVVTVGSGPEFVNGIHDIDIGANTIRITERNPGGGGFGAVTPHEYRFVIPKRIIGFSLTNNGFGTLSAGDISFTAHRLTVNVSGLMTQEDGYAEIQLQYEIDSTPIPTLSLWAIVLLVAGTLLIALISGRGIIYR